MGARKLRVESQAAILARLQSDAPAGPAAEPVAADGGHAAVASPAMLLQNRLDAAVAVAPWNGRPEPAIGRWPGLVRLGVLAIGATASWVAVAAAIRALI